MSEFKLIVQRFNPFTDAKPKMAEYSVPKREGMACCDTLLREGLISTTR